METSTMTPWERINEELIARRRDWKWLAGELMQEPQTVNHWKSRGVPAKYFALIEDVFEKARGWALDGIDGEPKEFSEMAKNLAELYDLIPRSSALARSRAYNLASEAIRREIPDADAKG
jgi:hypothetical protein